MRPFGPDRPPEQCETLIGGTCFARWEQGGASGVEAAGDGALAVGLRHLRQRVIQQCAQPVRVHGIRSAHSLLMLQLRDERAPDESLCVGIAVQGVLNNSIHDGMRWEWYRVLADSETFGTPTPEPDASAESVGCFR